MCLSYTSTALQIDLWLNSNTPHSRNSVGAFEALSSTAASWKCDSQCTEITICSALNEEKDGLQRSAGSSFIKRLQIRSSTRLHWFQTQPLTTFPKSMKGKKLSQFQICCSLKGFKGLKLLTPFTNRSSGLSQHAVMTACVKWAWLCGLITVDVLALKICISRGECHSIDLPGVNFSSFVSCDVQQQLKFQNKLCINVE